MSKFEQTAVKLLLFTKKLDVYNPFVEKCHHFFEDVFLINPSIHPFRKDKNYQKFFQQLSKFNPDLVISFYYNRMIQSEIVKLSKIASLNFHGSLLPNYAGSHALNWQIINGEKESGVTLHKLTNKIDGGKIVFQKSFTIKEDDNANSVLKKGIDCSCEILDDLFLHLKSNSDLIYLDQRKTFDVFKCKKRLPEDGEIKRGMTVSQVKNLSRGLVHPWPGVYYYNKKGAKISFNRVLTDSECKNILEILNV